MSERIGPVSQQPVTQRNSNTSTKHTRTRQSSVSWELMEEPGQGARPWKLEMELERQEGYLLKKCKWPLKGWHKRYFILERGILTYAKTQRDTLRGKFLGSINVGLAVMSINKRSQRIDLDTEENLYHLKVKSVDGFSTWVSKLGSHRLQLKTNIPKLPYGGNGISLASPPTSRDSASGAGDHLPTGWPASHERRLLHTEEMDIYAKDLEQCQSHLEELNKLMQRMEVTERVHSAPVICDSQASFPDKPKKEKRSSMIWCTQSYAREEPVTQAAHDVARSSVWPPPAPSLPDPPRYRGLTATPPLKDDHSQLQRDFCSVAQRVHLSLRSVFNTLSIEREKLRQTRVETEPPPAAKHITNLNNTLSEVTAQNTDLRDRLLRIQCLSSVVSAVDPLSDTISPITMECRPRSLTQKLSLESMASLCESHAEFFDAEDVLLSACSSDNEASDGGSYSSEVTNSNSEENQDLVDTSLALLPLPGEPGLVGSLMVGEEAEPQRRSSLPCPGPQLTTISLWNILRNNIGKDLSSISMPIQLNEPLNTLQRLCEDLEYSHLLDTANNTTDPFLRMVYVAAFAVSGYAAAYYRARSKPFNPVLGETYECVREDRGFRFIAEQVSHHPPVSVCHAQSSNFVFWQDVRWKNKFWGKSLEIVPIGNVNVQLPRTGDQYQWSKVTSCIHNILSGQRCIQLHGDLTISSGQCHCHLSFSKTRSNVNEVQGAVLGPDGRAVHQLFGKWHEGLHHGSRESATCVWQPGEMPADHELYYGFTAFARQLNQLTDSHQATLPPTDSRLRPDQRLLEEGKLEAAETQKLRIEQLQRERQHILTQNGRSYQPRFFLRTVDATGKESWTSNGIYWDLRKDPGFSKVDNPVLW